MARPPRDGTEDLGPCCVCEGTRHVRNIFCLAHKSPIPGHGWGCVVCGLPSDGATAVVCDDCLQGGDVGPRLRFACRGYPGTEGRVPLGELRGTHEHDRTRHFRGD
jgi:hypothetical protein